jgi:hypothetical protein
MANQSINIGIAANDGSGDSLRAAFTKCNSNFTELYTRVRSAVPATVDGSAGDVAGMIAYNGTHLYVCVGDYDGSTNIWVRTALSTF